ncbi:MAG: peptidoglycan -binding protein [Chromatiaceae bacterium]|nr:peptidoglycan -binding protein [Chromatiaceae bacterium]MCP5314420.1 peptidoglycan -binding protein [Chromatiaceae bacterium]
MATRRRHRAIDVWPGYVDVLAALLMLVIFVLMLFSLAQFLLSQILDAQENELGVMYERVVQLTDLLGLEQEKTAGLSRDIADLTTRAEDLEQARATLTSDLAEMTERDAAKGQQLQQQLLLVASLQEDVDALRALRSRLEAEVGILASALDRNVSDLGAERDRSKGLEARLADQAERTLLAQRELEQRDIRIQALSALVDERERAIEAERRLTADAQAEVALLNQKLDHLRDQLAEISQALAAAELEKTAQADKIRDLGERLNIALAREVNRLERYRSDFFGRLREVLGNNPSVRIVGDRFVLPSELLFGSGSATLGDDGRVELAKLAATLRDLVARIPPEIDWILRIDGHTDRVPINTTEYRSNWELSTARAVSVLHFLIDQGIPPDRLSAAGFGEFHPIDPADSVEAYSRNRRIELKLTSR